MIGADTIAAVSTPPGKGGVALLRISGPCALSVAAACFRPRNGPAPTPRRAVWGDILYEGEPIDDGMLTLFPAPHSYTGEDTAEITCHGGVLLTQQVLEGLLLAGARLAEPGEFTRRAFVSGRLSLSEAEAIGGLLEAKSDEQLRLFRKGARDRLSLALEEIHQGLLSLLSALYAKIDYPEEDLAEFTTEEILDATECILEKVRKLLATYPTGRAIAEGIPTVLCGKANVGKSSLYNLLCGRDAAIVTEYAGTTRDILEATVPCGRVLLRLSDTAGIRENTEDPVEKIGIQRSGEAMAGAELLLAVFDLSSPAEEEDLALLSRLNALGGVKIALCNKSDLPKQFDTGLLEGKFHKILSLSAKEGDLAPLQAAVEALFTDGALSAGEDPILSSARQCAALKNGMLFLENAKKALQNGIEFDASASDMELALSALAECDGRKASEEIVDRIFSSFCVGK